MLMRSASAALSAAAFVRNSRTVPITRLSSSRQFECPANETPRHPAPSSALRGGRFRTDIVFCSIRFPPIRATRMAVRVYLRLNPVVDLRPEEAPGLPLAFTERVSGDFPVASHLLNCSVVNTEHLRDFGVVDVVLDGSECVTGFGLNQCNLPHEIPAAASSGQGSTGRTRAC